ncbi:IQ and AAA domain-containing protein 1-like [Musca vetustissima]|uniref:IQ and AAA domain-containing protein 1-like n=1 Tax=Musca vetustissima TaxID=27455 RepID=UPI002AB78E1C|nr:IQ and AAA domain-containing protein 1-like [Musca vetustissima]
MSFDFNYKIWVSAKHNIDHLIKRQNVLKKRDAIVEPVTSFRILSELYILYVELAHKLSYLYRKTLQVQKRNVIKELVDPVMRTLRMLKSELCNIELSEYVYMDRILVARKLLPYNLYIWRSPDFLQKRPLSYQNLIYNNNICIDEHKNECRLNEEKSHLVNCVTLLQAHERARRSRYMRGSITYSKTKFKCKKFPYRFSHKKGQSLSIPIKRTTFNAFMVKDSNSCQDILKDKLCERNNIDGSEQLIINKIMENAAMCIQSAWRMYTAKKINAKNGLFQKRLYGMVGTRRLIAAHQHTQSIMEFYKEDLMKQMMNSKFEMLIIDERTRLLQERAPNIMEDISDHIRAWFRDFYDKTGDFHPYPEAAKNGTVLVLLDESMNLEEFKEFQNLQGMSKEEKKARAEKEKQKRLLQKANMKKQKLKEAKRRKKLKDSGVYDIAYQLTSNKDIDTFDKIFQKYSIEWRNVDEYLNKNYEAISEWVTQNELVRIHKDLRNLVDEYMRLEYELLKKSRCEDNKEKYKPSKDKKAKSKIQKKRRKILDPTESRTIESMFQELRETGIIEEHKKTSFGDFVGDFNFIADDTRDENNIVTIGHELADMKAVIEECLLGYGAFVVDKPKSICIIGPANSGKRLMCNIIATELDAVLLNLSPEKTYQFADNVDYFVQMVMKVAKVFQPSIIFINDVHRLFWKKIPKDEIDKCPTLLQSSITKKILKTIKKDDKIMLLGTSDAPWSAKSKFKKVFQKIILVPKSGYGSIFLLWMNQMSQLITEDSYEDYIISALTKVLRSYNTGEIVQNAQNTLNLKRRMRLSRNALDPMEFLNFFMQRPEPLFPPQEKIIAKFEKWYNKTNTYSKSRAAFVLKNQMKKDKK